MRSTKLGLLVGAVFAISTAPLAYSATPTNSSATTQSARSSGSRIEEIVVTAERRSESIQNAPVAMSAFTSKSLRDQRIETPQNLSTIVPNMAFQPGNYGQPNFIIRGIGYQITTVTGEPGVVLDVNDNPITASRIAKAGFLDVQRIEVLRGPQGTLYGRNATGGVVNIITNKPDFDGFSGGVSGDLGNYDMRRIKGHLNIPINDQLAVRIAGMTLHRKGYLTNIYNNQSINGRDLSDVRFSVRYKPVDNFTADLMYEGFREDDDSGSNASNGFSICNRDPGPASVGGVSLTDGNSANTAIRNYLSFGCPTRNNGNDAANLSIYNPALRSGIGNSVGALGGRIAAVAGLSPNNTDINRNNQGIVNKYNVNQSVQPFARDKNNLVQLKLAYNFDSGLEVVSQSSFNNDILTNYAGGGISNEFFTTPPGAPRALSVPQILNGNPIAQEAAYTYNNLYTREFTEELRVISHFDGAFNFSAGILYDKLFRRADVYILDTSISYFAHVMSGYPVDPYPLGSGGGGHYYYQSLNPYHLTSKAVFADMTWNVSDAVTVRFGVRYTQDKKEFLNNNSAGNLLQPGFGVSYGAPLVRTWKEPTGRLNIEWRPDLPFTDSTMFYALYSRGYKGGGFNPPNITASGAPPIPVEYSPEFVNDLEVGMKNTLLNNSLVLNLNLFQYDYRGYQFTRSVLLGVATANVNAKIYGLELQSQWVPVDNLAFNFQLGAMKTKIKAGADATSIDYYNLTQGVPGYFAMHDANSACIVNTSSMANLVGAIKAGFVPANALFSGCPSDGAVGAQLQAAFGLQTGIPLKDRAGVPVNVAGNRLPDVPSFTAALGVQYTFPIVAGWHVVPRLDYRYRGDQYSDLFNDIDNRVRGFGSVNMTVTAANDSGLSVQLYAQNLGSKGKIIGVSGGSTVTGSSRGGNWIDPPLYGVSVQKQF